MNAIRSIFHLMYADLLERVRSYSFMVVMALTVLAGYLLVPPIEAPYTSFVISSHRGFYNSPWVGIIFGLVACTLLALFGFFLVKNTVQRDSRTRVGQIIASTPLRKPFYTLGKWLSNLAILTLILAILTVMAAIMQYVRAEDPHIDLGALAAPIWLMGFPALALVSALAVLFECIPLLRGGIGNVVYFFIWGPVLVGSTIGSASSYKPDSKPRNDFAGLSRSLIDIQGELFASGYDADHGVTGVIGPKMGYEISRFTWNGIAWTANIWLERAMWLGGAMLIALAASIPFDRFDPAQQGLSPRRRGRQKLISKKQPEQAGQEHILPQAAEPEFQDWANIQFKPRSPTFGIHGFMGVLTAELKLMFKGLHWMWYLITAGLIIACVSSPINIVRAYLLPIAWMWPLLIWSQMGTREHRFGTWQMVFAVRQPILRQLPAMWLAGALIAAVSGSGAAFRFAALGAWTSLFAWFAGVLFIPALALMLGVWTNTRRMFEMVYLLWWYMAFNGIAALDFIGTTQGTHDQGNPWVFLGLVPVILGASLVGRWRQLQG